MVLELGSASGTTNGFGPVSVMDNAGTRAKYVC
jgi:hypothetical protein